MSTGQLSIVGGKSELQVDVRGTCFDVAVLCRGDHWEWYVNDFYSGAQTEYGTAPTYASAYRAAMRACDGAAPFRKYERRVKKP